VHRDEVQTLPAGAVVLAGNGHSKAQAMVYEQDGVCFWGSQYHPEYSARYVGEILRDIGVNHDLASNMMRAEQEEVMALALGLSQAELGHDMRTLELQNWLAMVVARVAA
jgi:GMP synthase (glutamine-hydrolysing)